MGGWRRMPVAVFPVALGIAGLGQAVVQAARVLPLPPEAGWAILALGGLLLAVAALAYARKLAARPGAILADLAPLPSRGAPSAGAMTLAVCATALVPAAPQLAAGLLALALLLQAGIAVLVALILWRDRAAGPPVTPVLMLPFVGQIAAAPGLAALGAPGAAAAVLLLSAPVALLILVLSLLRLRAAPPPPPGRPGFVILVTPFALLGIGASALGAELLASLLFLVALVALALLLVRIRWLTAGGWNPGWAAFTFPVASLAALAFREEVALAGVGAGWVGLLLLLVLVPVVGVVAARTLSAWADGRLARMTGAASA